MKTNPDNLPPYGVMEISLEDDMADPIPEAWIALSGDKVKAKAEYDPWVAQLIADLSSMLWPTYNRELGKWAHPPSVALVDADFELFKILQPKMGEEVKGLAREKTKHEVFFAEEDDEAIIFGHRYERYDPSLPVYLRETLTDTLWTGCDRKMGGMHIQVKQELQRPRPYQVAFIEKLDFHHVWAKSGGTPAMISGHCLQGITGVCSAYLLFGRHLDSVSVDTLKQFMVDIGDRRVFGGVHYPSDNLSSWYTAFKLIPHVVEPSSVPAAMQFMWEGITKKSEVYAAISDHIRDNAGSPFRAAMEALSVVAQAPFAGGQLPTPSGLDLSRIAANGQHSLPA